MKVMSIAKKQSETITIRPSQHYARVRALPCEVVECEDASEVYEQGDSADVILLPGAESSWPDFWNGVADHVEHLRGFLGIFSMDSYQTIWKPNRHKIGFDALLPNMYSIYRQYAEELAYDCPHTLWSPYCIDLQDHDVEKDIDFLFWGNPGLPSYPFRNFVMRTLPRYTKFEKVEGELISQVLCLDGDEYNYVRLPHYNTKYWGSPLYPLLARAKVALVGSMNVHVPVSKHFEHAACGCLSLTNDFSDREALGFEHGVNIWLTTEEKFVEDLSFLLRNDEFVAQMAANAKQLIAERHTVKKRAEELHFFLERILGEYEGN
jgi:hypothetical protein